MGVFHEFSPVSSLMLRNGGEKAKRSIKLRDDSGAEVELTLWGDHAENLGQKLETMLFEHQHPVLACKRACVGEYNGKNLSIRNNTVMDVNPDHPKRDIFARGTTPARRRTCTHFLATAVAQSEETTDLPPSDKSKTKPRTAGAKIRSGLSAEVQLRTSTTATRVPCIPPALWITTDVNVKRSCSKTK